MWRSYNLRAFYVFFMSGVTFTTLTIIVSGLQHIDQTDPAAVTNKANINNESTIIICKSVKSTTPVDVSLWFVSVLFIVFYDYLKKTINFLV